MKLETLVLIAGAAAVGWHLSKRKSAPAPVAKPLPGPVVVEHVYIDEGPYWDYGYGYPRGGWYGGSGRRHGGGGHRGHHGGGHGGGHHGGHH